jgi:hypothetical protein
MNCGTAENGLPDGGLGVLAVDLRRAEDREEDGPVLASGGASGGGTLRLCGGCHGRRSRGSVRLGRWWGLRLLGPVLAVVVLLVVLGGIRTGGGGRCCVGDRRYWDRVDWGLVV